LYDWWDASRDAVDGGVTLTAVDTTDTSRIPLYVRRGAIVP